MPVPIVRKTIWAIAALLAAALLVVAALPVIASTQIVRARIAEELSDWSGYRVTLGGAPAIEIWPSFRTVLTDVRFHSRTGTADQPVLQAERIEAHLSAWRAIGGSIVFSRVNLERPLLRVRAQGRFAFLPESSGGGRFYRAIEDLRAGRVPVDEAFGSISFRDGRIVETGAATPEDLAVGVTGTIDWPGMAQPAALNATGTWRGEVVGVAAFVEAPQALLSGARSTLNASFQAAPFTATYNGSAAMQDGLILDGNLTSSSPSLRRALEWSEAKLTPAAAIGAVSVKGKIQGGFDRLKVENAEIAFDGNPGVGALEIAVSGATPTIAGTLAFDHLDIASFLAAFSVPATPDTIEPQIFDLSFTEQINLDLRLSAGRASVGAITMTEVAATAQVRSGLAAFDISDATAFGGVLQAGFRVDRRPEGDVGEMRVSASEVDWGAVAAATGWQKNAPQARGSLSAVLKSPVQAWSALPRLISGTISGKLGGGSISGINLAALLAHRPEQGFFPLSDAADGTLAIDSAEFKATLIGGAARLDSAVAQTPKETVRLAGIISYVGQSLAMSASVGPRQPAEPGKPDTSRHFFIGGSWTAPFLTPSLPVWTAE